MRKECKHLDSNYFIEHPSLYHKLIEKNLFEALHALMNMSVYEKYLDVTLTPKFLDSISSVEHPYPDDPLYDRLELSFMHKLLDCPDPLVKYHPLVSLVVREKLRFYRWWYVFTFLLYIIFLTNLYYALIEASYLCDDMLLSYDTPSSLVRAFYEIVVVCSWIILRISMKLSFLSHWSILHRQLAIIDSKNDEFSDPTWRSRLNRSFSHLFPALSTGIKINPTLITFNGYSSNTEDNTVTNTMGFRFHSLACAGGGVGGRTPPQSSSQTKENK